MSLPMFQSMSQLTEILVGTSLLALPFAFARALKVRGNTSFARAAWCVYGAMLVVGLTRLADVLLSPAAASTWLRLMASITALVGLGYLLAQRVDPVQPGLMRHLLEAWKEDAELRTRRAEERIREVVDQIRDYAILRLDIDGCVATWNAGAERLTGWSEKEILGRHASVLLPEEVRHKYQGFLARALREGRAEAEGTILRKDGTLLLGHGVVMPLHDRDTGVHWGFGVVTRDITRERNLEQVAIRQREALEASNQDLQQFAYIASHDLQEPLRTVRSFVGVVLRKYSDKLDTEGQEYLNTISRAVAHLQTLIDDILAYSRVATRGQELVPQALAELAREAQAEIEAARQETRAQVHLDIPEEARVKADSHQVIQVFTNLLSNALKFAEDTRTPEVRVSAVLQDGFWRVRVQDNGIGMNPDHTGRLFQMFQRLNPRGKYPGTGMGLAICKRIVDRHGGIIVVENTVLGQGTTFAFTLMAA